MYIYTYSVNVCILYILFILLLFRVSHRKFPIDMAGFAINVCLLMKHPNVLIGKDKAGKLSKPGHLESNLLEQLVSKELLECRGPPKEVSY